jgi:hypothetical protein
MNFLRKNNFEPALFVISNPAFPNLLFNQNYLT